MHLDRCSFLDLRWLSGTVLAKRPRYAKKITGFGLRDPENGTHRPSQPRPSQPWALHYLYSVLQVAALVDGAFFARRATLLHQIEIA